MASLDSLSSSLVEIWRFQLLSISNSNITIGNLIVGTLCFFGGLYVSKLISAWLSRRLLVRFSLHEGAVAALQTLAFYGLVLSFSVLALNLANIPLTIFTVLGGALALGVGFGSQNIVNNFISGLILLVERPIRVGDTIDVDGLYGTVEMIGMRSTRIKSLTNIEYIVPNSSFLEKNVMNWTLSSNLVRTTVSVGVVYGSPVRTVESLLHEIASRHSAILKDPAPSVIFGDFGDNSLLFHMHFWVQMKTMAELRKIESDVRFAIDEAFRAAAVVIAFPQRDVHLDTVRPLDVRLVSEKAP